MNNPQEYTSDAKNWWHRNSDKLDCDWDTFREIWMAAINNDKSIQKAIASDIEKEIDQLYMSLTAEPPVRSNDHG